MRDFSPALASHLASGVTTLCKCWRLTRRDGTVAGFTEHDRDLSFDGITFAAACGLSPSDVESQLGLGIGGAEVSGALTGLGITEADIAAGRYDNAEVTTYLVNWADTAQHALLDIFTIGEIRRADGHFIAELRSIAHRYDEPQGRLYRATCDADFADSRCKMDAAVHTLAGTVLAGATATSFSLSGFDALMDGWATGGRITFTSGTNAGITRMVRQHHSNVLELWEPLPAAPAAGDLCSVLTGCDKRFATCGGRFGNTANFRGFPHIPTPDFVMTYARAGEGGYDGGALDP